VDVSADGGATWHTAELTTPPGQPLHRRWAWSLWEAEIPLAEALAATAAAADSSSKGGSSSSRSSERKIELLCKAVDAAYNVQPETAPPLWNLRGVLSNSWHRVKLRVVQDEPEE
jgi:sulfite oxidase